MAYKLQLPEGTCIHPVFHVSLLKKYVGDASNVYTNLPPVSDEGAIVLESTAILDHLWIKHGGRFMAKGLVQWKHLPAEEATWEAMEALYH